MKRIKYIPKKSISILSSALINHLYRCIALKCQSCFNTGEPAAVFGFPLKKTVKIHHLVETAAAGLLFKQIPKNFATEITERRRRTEDGRQTTEDGRQKTEDGRRRTEDGGQKTEDRRRKTEDCRQNKEEKWHF
jgi:hypothetical protein